MSPHFRMKKGRQGGKKHQNSTDQKEQSVNSLMRMINKTFMKYHNIEFSLL